MKQNNGLLLVVGLIVCLVVAAGLLNPTVFGHAGHATQQQAKTAGTANQAQSQVALAARINQLDPAQYASQAEYETWANSTCSMAALTAVMNGYGRHFRITDVLLVGVQLHAITASQGLLQDDGVARVAEHFGFSADWGHQRSLTQIIAAANAGHPVIVSFPAGYQSLFPNGHFLTVIGGNATSVTLLDSSSLNLHSLSRSRFDTLWEGVDNTGSHWGAFSAIVTPATGKGGQA